MGNADAVAAPKAEALTPGELETALARLAPDGPAAAELAARVVDWFGAGALDEGPAPRVEELTAAWAIRAPGEDVRVRVLADDGTFALPLTRLGASGIFAGAATLQPGTAFRWNYEVTPGAEGRRSLLPNVAEDAAVRIRGRGRPLEVYPTHPECRLHPDGLRGTLTAHSAYRSAVFPGTTRDWWVYVPAECRPDAPACVMVFQDGKGPKDYIPAVLDNLIARGDIPVTVGIFIDPGVLDGGAPNRSFEYDTLSDQYARFLLDEILPLVSQDVALKEDAASRAISGISSGGICSFTVAWERPEAFSKVLSWVGSFTDIRGGHNYAPLVRRTPRKPIRVFLQDGKNDLNVGAGDWWLANLEMASALQFAGYDFTTAWGNGFHSAWHGRAILPDSLRWLWRGYPG
jgi:enterochelin esterase family protein